MKENREQIVIGSLLMKQIRLINSFLVIEATTTTKGKKKPYKDKFTLSAFYGALLTVEQLCLVPMKKNRIEILSN